MIECRGLPRGGCVAGLAQHRNSGGCMVRILGRGKGRRVTGIAIGWRAGIAVRMAFRTFCTRMCPGQRESGQRVVKARIQPVFIAVTHLTIRRIRLRFVIFRAVILHLVARQALRLGSLDRALMTIGTLLYPGMATRQCKPGRLVIKG